MILVQLDPFRAYTFAQLKSIIKNTFTVGILFREFSRYLFNCL